jgi:hypothetical protein
MGGLVINKYLSQIGRCRNVGRMARQAKRHGLLARAPARPYLLITLRAGAAQL